MALWLCEGQDRPGHPCRTLYAVGLSRCPRCHSTDFHELGSQPGDEEHPMAKITRHGGPSDARRAGPAAVPATSDAATAVDEGQEVGESGPVVADLPAGVEVVIPADGTWSEWIEGDGTGEALPPVDGEGAQESVAPARERGPVPPRPAASDSKARWADHAVSLGMSRAGAAAVTRRDLINIVGAIEAGTHVVAEDGTVVLAGDVLVPVGDEVVIPTEDG